MKRGGLAIVLVCLIGGSAWSIPICDYRSPLTDLSSLSIAFSYDYHNDPYALPEMDTDAGRFLVDYSRLFDTPDVGYDITGSAQIGLSVLRPAESVALAEASGNYKWYFLPEESYFGFAGASGASDSTQGRLGLSITLGAGLGRFGDVTPLARAMEINDYLLGRESITRSLVDLTLETLAYEIDSSGTYDSFADLLGVLQDIIEGTGLAKAGGLDALDVYGIAQILEDRTHKRFCGGDIKAGIGYELLDPQGASNSFLATASFNAAFTSTPREQLLVRGSFSRSYDVLSSYRVTLSAGYDCLLTDTVTASLSYRFSSESFENASGTQGDPANAHQVALDLVVTPVRSVRVALEILLEYRGPKNFLEWQADVGLSIGMDLL